MSKINKIITNKPITLTQEEVANLSETLSAVRTAGGGGGGATYGGDGRYIEITGNNTITLTTTAANQLDRTIPTKVSDLTDSANYATVESLTAYQVAGDYLSANALNSLSGTWETVTAKLDETEFAEISGDFLTETSLNGYATENYVQTASAGITGWVNDQGYLKTVPNTYYLKTETSGKDELSAAFNDILKYNVTAAAGIEITTATDAGIKTFGISMTAEPVVTDTTLSGYNGIAATRDGEVNNQWNIGLTQDITNTINGKLNSSDFTTYTGTTAPNTYLTKTSADTLYQPTGDYVTTADVLTGTSNTLTGIKIGSTDYTIPTTDLSNYYTKTQVDSTFASASQLNSYLTTAQYQTDSATYAKKTDLEEFVTSSDITTQDTDYVMTTTGWKVLTLPGGGMTQVIHDTTLTGQGNANDNKLGVAWSALSGNTIASALSANSATVAANLGTSSFADITGAINAKADATAISDMLTKSEATQTYQTIAGMSNYLTTTVASQTYLDKTTYATDSATFVTSSNSTIIGTKQYALTTAGWAEVSTPTIPDITANNGLSANGHTVGISNNNIAANKQYAWTTTGWEEVSTPTIPAITAESGISADGYKIGLTTTAINAITSVSSKVDIPDTSLVDKYLALRTDNAGNVSGWVDLKDNFYSKTEATGTFVATANIDTTTLSGDGKSVSTKLGVKTDVIATTDYVNSSFLPTSGGTVSGQLVVSGGSTFDQQFLKITREGVNGYARLGLGQYGALALKTDDSNSHTTQVNISPNASNDQLVQVQHNGGAVGYLIPAVTATTTAGLTNDGILHIILES